MRMALALQQWDFDPEMVCDGCREAAEELFVLEHTSDTRQYCRTCGMQELTKHLPAKRLDHFAGDVRGMGVGPR